MILGDWLKEKIFEKKDKKLLFHLGVDAGFYSEFNNMIFCLIYCIENNISFELQTTGKINFYEKGWRDYFVPYFKERNLPFLGKYNVRPYMSGGRSFPIMVPLLKKLYNIDYFTQDVFDKARNKYKYGGNVVIQELKINCSLLELCAALIQEIYVFNDETSREIETLTTELSLPKDYVALHIRRGDKIIETNLLDENLYIQKALEYSNNIYIYTDNYDIIKKLKKVYPDINIFSQLSPKHGNGYVHKDFISQPALYRKESSLNMFANVEIISNSKVFIGSIDSNIGMFIAMRRGTVNESIDVDDRKWMIY